MLHRTTSTDTCSNTWGGLYKVLLGTFSTAAPVKFHFNITNLDLQIFFFKQLALPGAAVGGRSVSCVHTENVSNKKKVESVCIGGFYRARDRVAGTVRKCVGMKVNLMTSQHQLSKSLFFK